MGQLPLKTEKIKSKKNSYLEKPRVQTLWEGCSCAPGVSDTLGSIPVSSVVRQKSAWTHLVRSCKPLWSFPWKAYSTSCICPENPCLLLFL